MKLLSIIQATRIQEGSNDSYYAYHDAAKKWAKDTGQPKEKFAYAGTDVQDEYIEPEMKKYGLVPDSYQGKGVTKYRREDVNEGEERSIIRDACIEKLVDKFRGEEHQFENRGDLEYAIYSELERLDVEDCVDPDEEHGGQRMGDFASGGVLNVIDSGSVIDDVIEQLDTSELQENLDYLEKSKYKNMPMKMELQRVLAQILGIDNFYKMDVEDLEKQLKSNPANSTLWNEYSAYKKKLQIQRDDKVSPTIGNFASDNRDPRFKEGKSPHKKGSAKYKKHMAAMHAESEEEGRWAIYIDGKDAQVRFNDYVDAGEMEDKMKKKHPEKDIVCKKVGLNEVTDTDADQIIKQIISAYGIDKLEQVFREYFPRLSDEQVDKFLKDYRKSQLKVVSNEEVDLNDGMIGEPDRYYDEEDRKQAYQELQDALEQCDRTEAQYVKDGVCPNCAGSGYADADYEEEEDSCDGWGNYGCDEGEMTYRDDECSWAEIIKSDKRNADKQQAKDNYPGDEEVINQIRNMVMNMDDPRMAMQQMAIDYPHMGRAQRASLVAKGMKAAGLTNEGQRLDPKCWKGYKKQGTKMKGGIRVNNCVKKEGAEMNEKANVERIKSPTTGKTIEYIILNGEPFDKSGGKLPYSDYYDIMLANNYGSDIAINSAYQDYVEANMNVRGYNPGHPSKTEGRIEDTFATDRIDKHDKPEKKKDKKQESIEENEDDIGPKMQGIFKELGIDKDTYVLDGLKEIPLSQVGPGYWLLGFDRDGSCFEISKEESPQDAKDSITNYGKYKVSDADITDFAGARYYWNENMPDTGVLHITEAQESEKYESIQVGDELMIETAEGEGIVVPVLHVVGENILVGWDNLAEEIVVEGAEQLAELRKLAGLGEAEYQGRKVKLNKPTRGDVKKFKVYVKDPKTGNVKKVNFGHGGSSAKKAGQKTMKIKKSNPARRKSFRARHNCDNPGPKTKARYWSCRAW